MDFDTIVSLVIMILFFVLPTLAKQLKERARNQSGNENPARASNSQGEEFFGEVRQQEASHQPDPDDFWAQLAGGDEEYDEEYDEEEDYYNQDQSYMAEEDEPEELFEEEPEPVEEVNRSREPEPEPAIQVARPETAATMPGSYKANPLQNAVIWSEILGKPVGLRE